MAGMEELKEQYWRIVSGTRKSGRIAGTVKERMEGAWGKFDEDVIREALRIHIDRYKGYKESYTLGIMRNLQKKKDVTGKVKNENAFNNYMKQDYNFEELEKEIVANI